MYVYYNFNYVCTYILYIMYIIRFMYNIIYIMQEPLCIPRFDTATLMQL